MRKVQIDERREFHFHCREREREKKRRERRERCLDNRFTFNTVWALMDWRRSFLEKTVASLLRYIILDSILFLFFFSIFNCIFIFTIYIIHNSLHAYLFILFFIYDPSTYHHIYIHIIPIQLYGENSVERGERTANWRGNVVI